MSGKQTKIMFVDDDLVTGRVMKRNCDNAKYACSVFQNGQRSEDRRVGKECSEPWESRWSPCQ